MKLFLPLTAALSGLVAIVNAVTGDTQCEKAMCITAINHNNATTEYTLTVSEPQVGWMALGFGRSMIIAPLVVLWRNTATGDTIVSQRAASDFVMPTVVSNPNPVATPLNYRAASNSSASTLSFSVPSTNEDSKTVIWAWCKTAPSGNTVDATITQHDDEGELTLHLSNPLTNYDDGSTTPSQTTGPVTSYGTEDAIILTPSMKIFIAHGVLMTVGFMIILPLGALQARFLRTIVPGKWWFGAHWLLQWPLTTILITIGFALGVSEVNKLQTGQLNSTHKKWGLVLICLYIVQCSLGGIIHWFKSSKWTHRPPQNYAHAMLGLTIIGLAFWQVYTGMRDEWPGISGYEVPMGYCVFWKVWVIVIPILYLFGLALLPRQYRIEREQREKQQSPVKISAPKLQERVGNDA